MCVCVRARARACDEPRAFDSRRCSLFRTHGPFDGVLGFSQGGCLAALLAALQQDAADRLAGRPPSALDPQEDAANQAIEALVPHVRGLRLVVVIGAFGVRDQRPGLTHRHALVHDATPRHHPLRLPSFHIWGEADTSVAPRRSQALRNAFSAENRRHYVHPSGHWGGAIKQWPVQTLAAWLRPFAAPATAPDVPSPSAPATAAGVPSPACSASAAASATPPLPTFAEKLKATKARNADFFSASADVEAVLTPAGLHHPQLLEHPFWATVVTAAPLLEPRGLVAAEAKAFVEVRPRGRQCHRITL